MYAASSTVRCALARVGMYRPCFAAMWHSVFFSEVRRVMHTELNFESIESPTGVVAVELHVERALIVSCVHC